VIGQMFLSTENIRVVQANKDNIEYYNKLYEESKSEEAKQKAIELAEFIKNNQPHICKRIFCCAKPYTGEEEDSDLESVVYSEGESGDEENRLGRLFLKMKEKEKQKRIRSLWYMMLAKAKGAVLVLDRFSSLTRRIYLFGTSKKLKFEIEKEEKIRWFIILPEGNVRMIWNFVVLLLLMYTAIFVPF